MKYKRLVPVLPYILVFIVLNYTVEMNVIAEYSVVTLINRISFLVVWILCFVYIIPRYNWKWMLLLGMQIYTLIKWALFDKDMACNSFGELGESHSTYYGIVIGAIIYLVLVCILYHMYSLIKEDDKIKKTNTDGT